MLRQDLLIQRYLDGELGAAEARATEHLLRDDAAAAGSLRRLESLGTLLARANALRVAGDADALRLAIVERLPATVPRVHTHVRIADLVLASAVVGMIILAYGLAGTLIDLVNLTLVATASVGIGGLMVFGARNLQRAEQGLLSHLLGRRIAVGGGVLVYRIAGVAIVVGGCYLAA